MKSLGRSYLWWPGMDLDIEARVQHCATCQEHQKSPTPTPLHPSSTSSSKSLLYVWSPIRLIITDNGSSSQALNSSSSWYRMVSVYAPQSPTIQFFNGFTETAVQTFKQGMKKMPGAEACPIFVQVPDHSSINKKSIPCRATYARGVSVQNFNLLYPEKDVKVRKKSRRTKGES